MQSAALGQESFKCEKLCQPHRTGPQQEQRDCLLGSLSPDRTSVRRLEGQKRLSDYQMSQMWHTSACRVQTNLFGTLGSLGVWTLGSTNVKGGLHLVLTRSPKNYKLLCTSLQEPILIRGITSVYGQDAVGPIQNLWVSSTLLGSKTTQPLETYCRSEQPNLSEAIRTTLQQWKWVTSVDFKDSYFHLSIQEQSRTYQISCPGSGIPVQSTVFRSVHCTHGSYCSSKKLKLMAVHKGIITHQYLDD